MSNSFVNHPEDGLLLRYIDGELPARKARQIARHLEACWQCRTEIEEMKSTVADCIRYRKNVLTAYLPDPPKPWADLSLGFARIDDSVSAESFFARIFRPAASLRWGIAAAVAVALVCGVIYQLRETPSVQAATLLKRAVAASVAHPDRPARGVRFRTHSQMYVRAAADSAAALPPAMQAKFESAHYDSANPLTARAFQAWRDLQAEEQDEVTTVADPQAPAGKCYRIRTTTAAGDVAAATLVFRTSDLVPVEGLLEFRNNEWIEFSEFAGSPDRSVDNASNVEVPERLAVPPSRLAVAPPRASVSVSEELQVLSALHQIGADLGDPVQVTRTADKVIVSGVGVPPQRRQLIQRTLESMPNVAVQFSEPVAAPVPQGSAGAGPSPSGNARASAPNSKILSRLEEQLGGRAEVERFSSQILDVDEAIMSRAYALRDLAQRFPADLEAGMSPADRRVMRDMAREHVKALSSTVTNLQHELTPVLAAMGGSATKRAVAPSATWQPATEDLARSARRVQVLLSVLLGVASGPGSSELPSDVLSAISDLTVDVNRCQQLLAQEGGG